MPFGMRGGVVDPVDPTDTGGHLARDRDGEHAPPESQPMHPALVPSHLPFGEVVDGVHHRRYPAEQHVRKRVAQSVAMGVHDLGPETFHGAGDPREHQRV